MYGDLLCEEMGGCASSMNLTFLAIPIIGLWLFAIVPWALHLVLEFKTLVSKGPAVWVETFDFEPYAVLSILIHVVIISLGGGDVGVGAFDY